MLELYPAPACEIFYQLKIINAANIHASTKLLSLSLPIPYHLIHHSLVLVFS